MKINILLSLVLIALCFSCNRNKEIPLVEHPRPDFEREVWQNLNGYWYFKADSTNIGLMENWQETPGTFTDKILVPFSWASPLSEIKRPKVNVGWYYRSFNLKNPAS